MFGFRRPLEANNDRDDEGGAYWGNVAINTPVQGAAHHLMLMALAALKRKAEIYLEVLGIPTMEVHDALYFFVKLKDMVKAMILGRQLLTKEPLETVKKEFPKVDFKISLEVEGKVGYRLGDTVESEGKKLAEALGLMTLETLIRESSLDLELKAA